jgi:predicted thioesterase
MNEPRSTATLTRVVTNRDTAAAWGDVFPAAAATPFVLGLAEITCHAAIAADLPTGFLTVGTSATIEHLAPSAVGAELVAYATLLERQGSRLSFAVTVHDGSRLVARVEHQRAVVSRDKIDKALAKVATTPSD